MYLLPPLVYVEKYLSRRVNRYLSRTFSLSFCGITMDVVMILPKKSAKNRRESTGICRIKISFSMFQCKNYKKSSTLPAIHFQGARTTHKEHKRCKVRRNIQGRGKVTKS